jgi:uncharacterized protein
MVEENTKMVERALKNIIQISLVPGKAVIILGARQTGKTTLLKMLYNGNDKTLWLNGDEPDTLALFENSSSIRMKALLAGYDTIVLDEAQRIPDVGLKIKRIIDQIPEVRVAVSGSSAFELANRVNEPLTGRKWEYHLYPFSFMELVRYHGFLDENRLLHHRLLYGSYPEVVNAVGNEKDILKQLSDSYLYKDILMWERIKKPEKIMKLLQALAFQLGSQVSYNELAGIVGLDKETIEKYLQLLEKSYVIFRLGAFSRNLRKELKRSRKIYFFDNGIRNAVIANFTPLELRTDIGALWGNYLISERLKLNHYMKSWVNSYFWRTTDQQEVDYLEEQDGRLSAYEFKWNPVKKVRLATAFAKAYPASSFDIITPENYEEFLGFNPITDDS